MQVTQHNEYVTHAVIGGKQAIDFGISSSAEFFNILSSTLYKDQILAVVREVLCNAWDAHIEAGCTDKPVEVTLTEEKIVIKDFGKGIHHDDMGTIYGTYGNSTKKNDGNQTGGFGLGCKAPFAYTDHFEVISCHDTVKTIYNLSKSSAQVQGKPGIIPIASFPTKETGLQVTIRIKNAQDYKRFLELIKRITKNGDMNISLNGKVLPVLGFDTNKGNFFLTRKEILDTSHKIMVRYGNVIYPVDTANKIGDKYKKITDHVDSLAGYYQGYKIIFQAPPHSISVTPSRESLSMQEHTVNTLNNMFEGYLTILNTKFLEECNKCALESIQKAVAEKNLNRLLYHPISLPITSETKKIEDISDLVNLAQCYMHRNYPENLDFRKKNIKKRLELLAKDNLINRGHAQTFIRAIDKVSTNFGCTTEKSDWLKRQIIAPVLTKLNSAGLEYRRLYVCDVLVGSSLYYTSKRDSITPATEYTPSHLFTTLPFLRNIVVLASNKSTMEERASHHETFKKLGATHGFLFYHVGTKAEDKKKAVEFFNTTGMTVVDLTYRQDWEPVPEKKTVIVRKCQRGDPVCLSFLANSQGEVNTENIYSSNPTRISDPKYVLQVSMRRSDSRSVFQYWGRNGTRLITKMFGDKGAVVNTSKAYDKLINKGAIPFDDYILDKVCNYIQNSPTIKEYWAYNPNRMSDQLNEQYAYNHLFKFVFSNNELMAEFSLANNLTEEDKQYLELYLIAQGYWRHSIKTQVVATQNFLNAIPIAKESLEVVKKFNDSKYIGFLDTHAFYNFNNPAEEQKAVKILIYTLNT